MRPRYNGKGKRYGMVYTKCKACCNEPFEEVQVAMKETETSPPSDLWEVYSVEPKRGDGEKCNACNAAVAELSSHTQKFEYFVGILNSHHRSALEDAACLCVCEGCEEPRNLRRENDAWRLYDHCCARDEKHAKGENEYWPFTKFTPTNEGWKIERREANTKQNELKFVGTINP